MELTFARCEQVLNTLPIGYYTGRRIETSLDEKAPTSFYSPMEDKIVVSYPIIAERMKSMPEGIESEEEAVRGMLYHEVSHAILTPERLSPSTPINIFEDERIESVLRNYYHGVDFRKQLYDIHGGRVPKARNAETAFFNAVRFGVAPASILKEVDRLIQKYASLNRASERYVSDYRWEVTNLYEKVAKEWKRDPDAFNLPPQSGGDESGEHKSMDSLKKSEDGKGDKGDKRMNSASGEPKDGDNSEMGEGEGEGEEPTEDAPETVGDATRNLMQNMDKLREMMGKCLATKPELSDAQAERLNEFQKTAETIIGNFNKKNSGGSGINAYSGVFNPRAVARKDYRYFERAMTTQGNNRFGTCHLNLIIDCSGSFWESQDIMNGILAVLSDIERKNRNFSMDVVFINHHLHKCESVRERRFKATGGNDIPANMKQTMLELQKPQTCNYNIVLFDGDAFSDNDSPRSEQIRRFGAFDAKQTTLITDPDNQRYLGKGFTASKVVITNNYANELINHITKAFMIAFG